MKKIFKLISSIFICQMAGVVGSFFTAPAISQWYSSLERPVFAPPNWLFAPVWISLFTLMGISFYLIWEKGLKERKVKIAMGIFFVQLFLNALWSFLFFGLRSPFYGMIEIIILWFFILFTIIIFYMVSRKAAFLLLPYIIWVTIASFLNYSIWQLNL